MKNVNDNTAHDRSLKDKVAALFELMKAEKLEELEIKEEDFYLHIKRKGRHIPAVHGPVPQTVVVPAIPVETPAEPAVPAGETVKSPITGVLYRAPSPTSAPFIKEGDVAEIGKTLCIVEAMKVMNEIKADSRVKILKILVENGKPVNAAQDLFLVEKL